MLRMAEARRHGTPQIASVSGHSIEATQRILETYLPRNRDLAEIAITRLAEYKKAAESPTRVQLLARKSLANKANVVPDVLLGLKPTLVVRT